MTDTAQPRAWLRTLVAVAVATAIALALAESVTRLSGVAALGVTDPIYRRSDAPGVTYELRPHARGYTWGRTWVEVNSLGLRGPEIDPVSLPGVYRVGVFGDSGTFGQGVAEEATYARVLERGDRNLQVLNFGVPSYNIVNIVSSFTEKGVKLGLRAAVIAPIVEDYGFHRAHTVDDFGYPVHTSSPIAPGFLKNVLRRLHLAYLIRDAWWVVRGAGTPELQALRHDAEYGALSRETWERASQELARFVSTARSQGVVPIYLSLGAPMPPVLEKIVVESGFERRIDLRAILAPYDESELRVSNRDGHPSPLYHRLVAEELGRALAQLRRDSDGDRAGQAAN